MKRPVDCEWIQSIFNNQDIGVHIVVFQTTFEFALLLVLAWKQLALADVSSLIVFAWRALRIDSSAHIWLEFTEWLASDVRAHITGSIRNERTLRQIHPQSNLRQHGKIISFDHLILILPYIPQFFSSIACLICSCKLYYDDIGCLITAFWFF